MRADDAAHVEAASYFPAAAEFAMAPERYLEHLRRIKMRVNLPVIASINGTTTDRWLEYAKQLDKAGAAAVELNFYHVATDPNEDGAALERRLLDVAAVLKESLVVPLAVKLSPFYSALPNVAARLQSIGVDGLVLFNRFYQPDIDPEEVDTTPVMHLSTTDELPLRLQWLAILSEHFTGSLAASGGIHQPLDAVKAVMAGADAVQIVSALMQHGPWHLATIKRGFEQWCEMHDYESIDELRDTMSLMHSPDPHAFERGNYLRILQSRRRPAH
jgi:dihydroorotate dehydrogenase (fumarate)